MSYLFIYLFITFLNLDEKYLEKCLDYKWTLLWHMQTYVQRVQGEPEQYKFFS